MNSYSFHQKTNSISPTISIIETTKGFKFGGYTEKTWGINDSYDVWLKDDNCFVFSLDYIKIYNNIKGTDAIFHGHKDYGPYFCFSSILIKIIMKIEILLLDQTL